MGISDFSQKISGKETKMADLHETRKMVWILMKFVGVFAVGCYAVICLENHGLPDRLYLTGIE